MATWDHVADVVTDPSLTTDMARELVMGMHGPRELHVVLIS